MAPRPASLLPVHQLLAVLEDWRADPSPDQQAALAASLERVLGAYGASGAYLALSAEALPELALGLGSLAGGPEAGSNKPVRRDLAVEPMTSGDAVVWVDAPADAADAFADVLQLAVDSAWSKQGARPRRRQLEGLDLAVRGIAGVLSVERVLQLIVDRVRELVDAEYAALGIVGPFGRIDQFVTTGLSAEEHARLGALPRALLL